MLSFAVKPIPGPSGLALWRVARQFRRDPLATLQDLTRTYGDLVGFRLGSFNAVLVSHPDDIKDILVTQHQKFTRRRLARQQRQPLLGNGLLNSTGDFHLRQRRLMQPAFHRQRVAAYATAMVESAVHASRAWQDGATVDLAEAMMDLSLAVVGKTLFDADMEKDTPVIREATQAVLDYAARRRAAGLFTRLLRFLPLPESREDRDARARLDAIVYRMIEDRLQTGEDRGDLLSMLLRARDTDGTGMTDEQLRDEVLTLIGAGFETTANWLAWTWYLLAQHPDVTARLHAELAQVLGGAQPTIEDVGRLPYLKQILSESLRLYPPVWMDGRQPLEDYEIRGSIVPAGTHVLMSQYVVHRDPRWFPNPDRFDPERWSGDACCGRPSYAFFPFGGGPHLCIGEAFSWLEATLALATLAQTWCAELAPNQVVTPDPFLTLRPKHGMPMTIRRRGS
jgi:cytochrome P450